MDLRQKKTIRSIQNAFLKLRSEKEIERIRIKEIIELAEISKGTFYLHYHDIYDLAEQMQSEVINNVIGYIEHPDAVLENQQLFTKELLEAFLAQQNLITLLFSHVNEQPMHVFEKDEFITKVGKENFCAHIDDALKRAEQILSDNN